jgi:hypothetical protein
MQRNDSLKALRIQGFLYPNLIPISTMLPDSDVASSISIKFQNSIELSFMLVT